MAIGDRHEASVLPRREGAQEHTAGGGEKRLPLAFKLAYLAFVMALVPVYAGYHGYANFLWFSNVALLGGLAAAWLESRRLASMLTMAVLIPELGWIIGFISGLLRDGQPWLGITAYMFDARIPSLVRAFALYHLALPAVLLWMVWRLGYDRAAWRRWLPIGWSILLASWLVTTPEASINWTFGPVSGAGPLWHAAWLVTVMLTATAVWWLTHKSLEAFLLRPRR